MNEQIQKIDVTKKLTCSVTLNDSNLCRSYSAGMCTMYKETRIGELVTQTVHLLQRAFFVSTMNV
jgi:hypothetical protein